MHMNKITTRTPWTKPHDRQVIKLYDFMLAEQKAGNKINKAKLFRELAEKQNRSKSSVEAKCMNISAVYEEMGFDIVTGLKPLKNYAKKLKALIEEIKS